MYSLKPIDSRRSVSLLAALVGSILCLAQPADASEPSVEETTEARHWNPAIGVHFGGHAFRDPTAEGDTPEWEDCRMEGLGVFAQLGRSKHFFGELSLDVYHASNETLREGMDRTSAYALGAAGARMFPDFWLSPNVKVGGGAEVTYLAHEDGDEVRAFPAAFIGFGLDFQIRRFAIGLEARSLATAALDHEGHHDDHETGHQALAPTSAVPSAADDHNEGTRFRMGIAGQGLLSLRYEF